MRAKLWVVAGVLAVMVAALAVVIIVVTVSEQDEPAAPEMTDEQYALLEEKVSAIDPALVDEGMRGHARDTCSNLDGDKAVENTVTRFSNADHEVTDGEAREILATIRSLDFC